jgi:hypothetical protein
MRWDVQSAFMLKRLAKVQQVQFLVDRGWQEDRAGNEIHAKDAGQLAGTFCPGKLSPRTSDNSLPEARNRFEKV